MTLCLIVAVAENEVIGREGQLPWRLSADLKRFKRLTMGHHLIMGRKTFESIGRLLPGRTTIVITRQRDFDAQCFGAPGAILAGDLPAALAAASGDPLVFVVGGAEIYRQALPFVQRLYVTRVHARVDGDVLFPAADLAEWSLREDQRFSADDQNEFDYSFRVYERQATAQSSAAAPS